MSLRFDIFIPVPEGLSRIDVFDQPEPGSPRMWMLGRMTFLAPRAPEPWQLGERVRFEPMDQSWQHRPSFAYTEPPSPPETTRVPVPLPSAPDNLLHYSPPPSARRSAYSVSSSGTNPQHAISHGMVREQSQQLERPESPGSYPRPRQSDAYPSDPIGRQSNVELEQESHSSRDSFYTASPSHPLPLTFPHPQPVTQNPWLTDNSRDGSLGGQNPWGHQAQAWNESAEPPRGAGRHDSYYESMPSPPSPTLDVEQQEEFVPAPQATVNLSPLEGQWEMSLRILPGESPFST